MKHFLLFIYILGCLVVPGCSCIINSMAYHPDTTVYIKKPNLPHDVNEVSIKTRDNLSLQAFYFHKQQKQNKLVIYFHGNAGNLYSRIGDARKLFLMGADVLLVSYRGYGKSEGTISENGSYIDGTSTLEHAVNELGYDLRNIFIYGRSIGTTVAVHIAQKRPLAGVILITPLTSGSEYARSHNMGCLASIAGNTFESGEKINNLEVPLLIIHGDKDETIPYSMGVELFEKYRGPKTLVTIENGNHNNLQYVDRKKYWGAINTFITSITR